jgi:hypothetical protein
MKKTVARKKKTARDRAALTQAPDRTLALVKVSTKTETRVVKKQWLTYKHPAQIIKDAKALTSWRLQGVEVVNLPGIPRELRLEFGRDDQGRWSVTVKLSPRAFKETLFYLVAHDLIEAVLTVGKQIDADDDGGEELPVPTISKAALAKMQPLTTGVQ